MANPLDDAVQRFRNIRSEAEDEVSSVLPPVEDLFPLTEAVKSNPSSINDAIQALALSRQDATRDAQLAQADQIDALITQSIGALIPTVFNAFTGSGEDTGLVDTVNQIPGAIAAGREAVRTAEAEANEAQLKADLQVAQINEEASVQNQIAEQEADAANAEARRGAFNLEQNMINAAESRILELTRLGMDEEANALRNDLNEIKLVNERLNQRLLKKQVADATAPAPVQAASTLRGLFGQSDAMDQMEKLIAVGGFNSSKHGDAIQQKERLKQKYQTELQQMNPGELENFFKSTIALATDKEQFDPLEEETTIGPSDDAIFAIQAAGEEMIRRGADPGQIDTIIKASSMPKSQLIPQLRDAIVADNQEMVELLSSIAITRKLTNEAAIGQLIKALTKEEESTEETPEETTPSDSTQGERPGGFL